MSGRRRSASISANAAAAPCSIGRWPNTICGSAVWWSRRWRKRMCSAPVDDIIDAHGEGRRRAVLHARRGSGMTSWKSASPRRAPITSSPSTAARSWRPDSTAPFEAAWAIAEALEADQQAARHPGRPRPIPASTSTCAAPARSARRPWPRSRASPTSTNSPASPATAKSWCSTTQPLLTVGRAQVPLPPGAFLQADRAKAKPCWPRLVLAHVGRRQARRRSVLRHRPVCLAARRERHA